MPLRTLLSFVIILLCACTYGQHISLTPGSSFTYRFRQTPEYKQLGEKTISYRFDVLGKDDSGYYRIKCTQEGFTLTDPDNPGKLYDSRHPLDQSLRSSDQLLELALLYQPFELLVNDKGKVIRYTNITEPVARKVDEWVLDPIIKPVLLSNTGSYMDAQAPLIFPPLPDNASGWQSGWLNADSTMKYQVSKKEGGVLHIRYTSIHKDPADTGHSVEQEGELQYDLQTRKVISLSQKTTSSGEKISAEGNAIPFHTTRSLLATLQPDTIQAQVPVNEIDLAVKMCRSSHALRNGPVYDSALACAFFNANDPANMHNKGYLLRKLDIIQELRATNSFQLYSNMLSVMPIAWLEGEYSHLFNKLQMVLANNTDSAYALIRYLSKSPLYIDWVQESLALALNGRGAKINRELIARLGSDADTAIRNAAWPLSLWVEVKAHSTDTSLQNSMVTQLEQLSSSQARQGNAGRYALLLYKQLYASGRKAMADHLLEHTIARLENETADETNKKRFSARNMLAYAWNLKYETVKTDDPQKALACLSKAAAYSPKNPSEMAYESFYDRTLLHSKESYRADFAAALMAAGDKMQAIETMAEQVKADPAITGELKKYFETNFPGKDFGAFFNDVIIRSWNTAPDFSLTGIDGHTTYRLADYKGKWLVLDFWGTWCSPCRKEMPDNNAFAKRIQQRADLAFVTIACHDNAADVKNYFASNGFDMPAAMSDNIVEKKYKVTGYPGKFIISPDGKMLPLQFGMDWKAIIEQFSAMPKPKEKTPGGNKSTLINTKD